MRLNFLKYKGRNMFNAYDENANQSYISGVGGTMIIKELAEFVFYGECSLLNITNWTGVLSA